MFSGALKQFLFVPFVRGVTIAVRAACMDGVLFRAVFVCYYVSVKSQLCCVYVERWCHYF